MDAVKAVKFYTDRMVTGAPGMKVLLLDDETVGETRRRFGKDAEHATAAVDNMGLDVCDLGRCYTVLSLGA